MIEKILIIVAGIVLILMIAFAAVMLGRYLVYAGYIDPQMLDPLLRKLLGLP